MSLICGEDRSRGRGGSPLAEPIHPQRHRTDIGIAAIADAREHRRTHDSRAIVTTPTASRAGSRSTSRTSRWQAGERTVCDSVRVRILQIAPLVAPLDERQPQLGGAQVILADLARGLARAGHAVTLAAADGSRLEGVEIPHLGIDPHLLRPADLGERSAPRDDEAKQRQAFARVRSWIDAYGDEIDVVHAHAYDAPAFTSLRGSPRPVAHTLHLPPRDAQVVQAARDAVDSRHVTVSHANARAWRDAGVPVRDVIHNGIDVEAIPLSAVRGPHLIYAGRVSPEKGVEVALDVAEQLGRGLLLVGGVYDQEYYARAIAPRVRAVDRLDAGVAVAGAVYLGSRPRGEVHRLMGGAGATLMPVRWDEPFGLVALESLATGTPVVAYRRGGLPELIGEDVGALVEPEDARAFTEAVARTIGRDPEACRRHASDFDVRRMVARYEELYASMLD
jgi:glycosyltransferase involved in cell wall biosynthesis